jgi:hypothetical protein
MTGCITGTKSGKSAPEALDDLTRDELKELLDDADLTDWRGQALRVRVKKELDKRRIEDAVRRIDHEKFIRHYLNVWSENYSDRTFDDSVERFSKKI